MRRTDAPHAENGSEVGQEPESAAVLAGLPAEALLLEKEEREIAAGVSPDQPFGVRGASPAGRGPLALGFSAAAGGLLAILTAYALIVVRHQLVLILIAGFVAVGLDPAVRFLQRHGFARRWAVAVVCLTVLALLVGFFAAVAAPLSHEASSLTDAAPGYLDQLKNHNTTLGHLNAQLHLSERAQELAKQGFGLSAGGLLSVGSQVASGIFDTVVVLVLIVYFLADLPRITRVIYRLAPRHRRPRVGLLGDEVINRVGGYVLGNIATSVITFVVTWPALLLLGVPYALVLAAVAGVLDLVPLVGSILAGAAAALVALGADGVSTAGGVVGFTVVYRLFADYVINPPVMRRTVDVSPLVTVLAVVIGGGLMGIVGALVAVPAAAAVQLLLIEVLYPARDDQTVP
ncbi:MAG TPA: AI-2E family transporter [Sporichthyaceae bacterium]|nr:AI-2E family transporter [Sporichthyaceae bacterium]